MKTKIEVPDLILVSDDAFKEKLRIYSRKGEIVFYASVDGAGQCWKMKKSDLKVLL